ncbi:MAG: metalloregulator ArsR/SmtB family transcription factor [Gemmatimonadales bacterium]|nr:metalloregulator ArsR/SmtB family transcription factor [Gemmatimonadales bacterium]
MVTLADGTRTRLLALLERHELAVSELCQAVQLPQSTVSRHLKVLADERWLISRPDGTSRKYRMAEELPAASRRLWELVRDQLPGDLEVAQDAERLRSVLAERRSRTRAFFDSAATRWDAVRQEQFGAHLDAAVLAALADDGWTVADLGCGTGRLLAALAPHVRRVIGVDGSREMLEAARGATAELANVELHQGELDALPLPDGAADLAVLGLVLHHLPDPARVVAEAARVLAPGGRLVVVDMLAHAREEYRITMDHQWLGFAAPQVLGWFRQAGLEAGRVVPLPADPAAKGPMLFVASGRVRRGGA